MTMNKTRAAVALAAVAAIPLAFAAPAQASTTRSGCTVTPKAPYFAGTYTAANVPQVYYPVDISCVGGAPTAVTVELNLQTWEQDLTGRAGDVDANGVNNADEDRIGSGSASRYFTTAGGSTTVNFLGTLPHTDTDSNEEIYDKTQFRVISGAVKGAWTNFEFSPVTKIWW
ncbi:hypothetical protein ACPPVT_05750 [Angustibacter sp. McL0619]|uniref:hypothetical protein n=1 Tax=Angustibacter sp. McL0619 TaxID=3415676 RepID=UPI003CEAE2EC